MAFLDGAEGAAPQARNPDTNSLKQKWLAYLGTPEAQAALVQFGSSMLTPQNPGQPFSASLGQAVGDAAGAVGRVRENQIADASRVQEQENVVAEREAAEARSRRQATTARDVAQTGAESRLEAAQIGAESRISAAQIATARQQGLSEADVLDLAVGIQEASGLTGEDALSFDTAVNVALRAAQRIRQAGETGVSAPGAAVDDAILRSTAQQLAADIDDGDVGIEQVRAALADDPQKMAEVQALLGALANERAGAFGGLTIPGTQGTPR
jgi:hypothetical protein